jgi:endonuclease III
MVDPINFTDYNRSDVDLEEMLLFSVLVAGKNAVTTARLLEEMLVRLHEQQDRKERRPFACLRIFPKTDMVRLLKDSGFGCYKMKGRAVYEVVHSFLNLRTCSVADLEKITGIGKKTSRMFILHSRPDAECAALDTHILHYLNDLGYVVPKATPGSNKVYAAIERICVALAKGAGKTVADWDLSIWRKYRKKNRVTRNSK